MKVSDNNKSIAISKVVFFQNCNLFFRNFCLHAITELTTTCMLPGHSFNTFTRQYIVFHQPRSKLATANIFGKVYLSWVMERNGVSKIWRLREMGWVWKIIFKSCTSNKYCIGASQPWNTGLQQKSNMQRKNNEIWCDRPLIAWQTMMIHINMEGQKCIIVSKAKECQQCFPDRCCHRMEIPWSNNPIGNHEWWTPSAPQFYIWEAVCLTPLFC